MAGIFPAGRLILLRSRNISSGTDELDIQGSMEILIKKLSGSEYPEWIRIRPVQMSIRWCSMCRHLEVAGKVMAVMDGSVSWNSCLTARLSKCVHIRHSSAFLLKRSIWHKEHLNWISFILWLISLKKVLIEYSDFPCISVEISAGVPGKPRLRSYPWTWSG